MLTMSRKDGESITVFDPDGNPLLHIKFKIMWHRQKLKVSFAAPRSYDILRTEILEPSDRENLKEWLKKYIRDYEIGDL